jgi:putative MFS transporter
MTEFVPPASRGRWMAFMAFVVVAGLPATAILGNLIIPNLPATATFGGVTIESFNWRPMFVIAGIGALIVWYLRKRLPESPRWLEAQGRLEEAEALMQVIEREAAAGRPLPPPAPAKPLPEWTIGSLLGRSLLPRMIVGCVVLITINTLIFGFVNWIPTFFVKQGLSVTKSLNYTLVIDSGSLIGCAIGAFSADFLGRRWTIIGASLMTIVLGAIYPFVAAEPRLLLTVGFFLIIGIYILTALLYGVYTAELFPTEVRLRANGICNTFGRGATIVSPFVIVPLFIAYGVGGVLGLMIGLLVIQIIVVAIWGIEPAKRGLEELDDKSADAAKLAPARP